MAKKKPTFIIIDANALLHRSYHALPPLTTKDGVMVNAVYGFLTVLFKVLKEFKPKYLAVAFDMRAKTFRHKEYADYKAGRVKQTDEFYNQLPLTKEALAALNVTVFEKEGFEADDIIGTLVEHNSRKKIQSVVVTGDKDAFQLIDADTMVFTIRKGISDTVYYDTAAVQERYGLLPQQLIDMKAIAGDPSDNIHGVRGIGEKGAINLLQQFGSLEKIYKEIDTKGDKAAIAPRYLKLLQEQREEAFMSQRLVRIVRDVPIGFELPKCELVAYHEKKTQSLFQSLGFTSLMGRLRDWPGWDKKKKETATEEVAPVTSETPATQVIAVSEKNNYRLVTTDAEARRVIADARKQRGIVVDTETTDVDVIRAKVLGVSLSWQDGIAYYFNIQKYPQWLESLKPLLEDATVEKYGHNLKYDLSVLKQHGIALGPLVFDTMVGSYLLDPGSRRHNLENLCFEAFGFQKPPLTDLIGKGKKKIAIEAVPAEQLGQHGCEDADYTYRLVYHLQDQLKEKEQWTLLNNIEMPLIPVLAEMERNGVKINSKLLGTLSEKAGETLRGLEEKIYSHAGEEFNINSPLQLKEVLFGKLKISTEGIGRTKTGMSTAAAELEKMADRHPIIALIQEYREVAKLKSTYLDALPLLVNPVTKRVHTSFNQTVTATGRLSSSDPNLQNIPVRTDAGRQIRTAFIAEQGYSIVSADYSQIELRIIASLANDEKMIESFKRGEDIHRRTAADVHEIPIEEVTKEQRYQAKEVNFGILYGMGAWGLASRQGVTREHAQAFIEKYFQVHREIQEYLDGIIALAHEQGYVETMLGRRRYLPDIHSNMRQVRAAAERMAVNMPVQGTAADLMKIAMINVYNKLPQVSAKARMLMQVHDELVLEVPDNEVKTVAKFIVEEMNNAMEIKVPIKAEVAVGKNWGELIPLLR